MLFDMFDHVCGFGYQTTRGFKDGLGVTCRGILLGFCSLEGPRGGGTASAETSGGSAQSMREPWKFLSRPTSGAKRIQQNSTFNVMKTMK